MASAAEAVQPIRRRTAMLRFAAPAVLVLIVVGVASVVASTRAATNEAIRDARYQTRVFATAAVAPFLTAELVAGDPTAIEALDATVRSSVLIGSVRRVKVWRADGTILYSDERRLIREQYELSAEDLDTLRKGGVEAEVSDLTPPENRYERRFGTLLEVYLPVRSTSGEPLLFEVYYSYAGVTASAAQIRSQFLPILLVGLGLLAVLQLPLAWRLITRLKRSQEDRERLLVHAIDSSLLERRRIARDLHDGVVQDLAGLSYSLAGIGADLRQSGQERVGQLLDQSAATTRGTVASLRTLLIDIYPPSLQEEGVTAALSSLLAPLTSRGIEVAADLDPHADELPADVQALLFRSAQELLRNVARHSGATECRIEVTVESTRTSLRVDDNGVGVPADRTVDGHVGLRLLTDLAAEMGGEFSVVARPGGGSTGRVEVPR